MAKKSGDSMDVSLADMDADIHRITRDYAFARLEMMEQSDLTGYSVDELKDISDSFHSSQLEILRHTARDLRGSELSNTQQFEVKARSVRGRLKVLSDASVSTPAASRPTSQVKLPKIHIKPFDGRIENWVSFKQLFDSLVHKAEIPYVEKLHYLVTSVEGPAYELIKSYPLSDDNYKLAYNALVKAFENKRQIAAAYYDKILSCKPVTVKNSKELERVLGTFTQNLAILNHYGLPDSNFMLFHLLWSKLDSPTKEAFELQHDSDVDVPIFKDVQNFIEKRIRALENSSSLGAVGDDKKQTHATPKVTKQVLVAAKVECGICSLPHDIVKCPKFKKLTAEERFAAAKEKKICIQCLSSSHTVRQCKSSTRCQQCQRPHHNLLHFSEPEPTPSSSSQPSVLASNLPDSDALFATAVVLAQAKNGRLVPVRALFDCGSACNFITQKCATSLGLAVSRSSQSINGIGQVKTDTAGVVSCEIRPTDEGSSAAFSLEAFVLPRICPEMPSGEVNIADWAHLTGLNLADPRLHKPGPIDMLLSVSVFASSLRPGLHHGAAGQPVAIETVFGWIVMGDCDLNSCRLVCHSHKSQKASDYNKFCHNGDNCHSRNDVHLCRRTNNNTFFVSLDNSIKRFWELENLQSDLPPPSSEDLQCEVQFQNSYSRDVDGRIVVPLPFRDLDNKPQFSGCRSIALKRFHALERKLKANCQFNEEYVKFMKDYLECRHMEEVNPPPSDLGKFFYIPHHGILRPDSKTTPLRVVFDGSAKDGRGQSLNDTLLSGPKLQKSIFDLLLRFRWHTVVFTGDIKQMYRQFLVPPEDADYQRILWRAAPDEPIRDYRLLTVTYGVSSAPYQALRSVAQLAEEPDCGSRAATVLRRDIYTDDIVTGADNPDEAAKIRSELLDILSSACLQLRKWTSNSKEFLRDIESGDLYSENFHSFEDETDLSVKILGLLWVPSSDSFSFNTKSDVDVGRCTKRSILSEIARIFDPLGLVAPVTFLAKYLIQLLWLSGVGWDDDAPETIADQWIKFKTQLPELASLSIPRRIVECPDGIQLHGYCDASERGFCAVIYCRTIIHGQVVVRLVCAKSKVAPLRKLSIPRLELLAAVLLSDLIESVVRALSDFHQITRIFAWSDSSVTLAWIKSCPSRWKTFVANRVTHIQDRVAPNCWNHVSTLNNPADCGSRGLLPAELSNFDAWWGGPLWLSLDESEWPSEPSPALETTVYEEQKIYTLLIGNPGNLVESLLSKFSSLRKLSRVVALCHRFINNLKNRKNNRSIGNLSITETNNAVRFLIKHAQECSFASELRILKGESSALLAKTFKKLSPFVDEEGLLRVGGRLSHSSLNYDAKHPLLLPRDHRLTALIIDDYHRRFMHPGLQTLQNLLSQSYWILSPRRAINSVISSCIKCFRARPRVANAPLMGDLPAIRVNQIKPFSSAAMDFAGPFDICLSRGRNVRTCKSYICVFVCTATKAIHLELVSELTSEAFIAGLRRFVARRGRCSRLVSDQGTNFVGASNIFSKLLTDASNATDIEFHFHPPGSPHFSGLVEAGVKSVKTHLSRVIGLQRLTFEELYTVLTQIEALLNSRPLTPMSSDPSDLSALTPGHFLTLEPLGVLPEEPLLDKSVSPLQRWKLIQRMHQDFWKRWHVEYIHTLQQRHKWTDRKSEPTVGMLVLVVNEQRGPMHWCLGRVIQLHPGSDGICRVVTVKTAVGQFKRPIVKLAPLPLLN